MENTILPSSPGYPRLITALVLVTLIVAAPSLAHAATAGDAPWQPSITRFEGWLPGLGLVLILAGLLGLCISYLRSYELGGLLFGLVGLIVVGSLLLGATNLAQAFNWTGAVI